MHLWAYTVSVRVRALTCEPILCTDASRLLHGLNQWPSSPIDFRLTAEAHIDKMCRLGAAIMRATAAALGLQPGSPEHEELVNATRESF